MDRERLKAYLDRGLSLNEIGALENRDPSTVGYWVRKHGLSANGREKYAPRGGIDRDELQALLDEGLTIRGVSERLGVSQSTVNYWLRRYSLRGNGSHERRGLALAALASGEKRFLARCKRHGETTFLVFANGRSRCSRCASEAVQRRRSNVKETLVMEAGGMCAVCGYNRYLGALQFHHLDRDEKEFGLATGGLTRSLDKARAEAEKCTLLCANCHAEVEGGVTDVP